MNIIFGKYQLNIFQFNNLGSIKNQTSLLGSRFNEVFGLGRTKILWILAQIGASSNSRVSVFLSKRFLIDREQIIFKSISIFHYQYIGVELKQLRLTYKFRKYKFFDSFKIKRIKKKKKLNSNTRKKL